MELVASKKQSKQRKDTIDVNCAWHPPEPDVLKINIDGCFLPDVGAGGWGFIIRDLSGEAVGSGAWKLHALQDPMQAEAEAYCEALQAAQGCGMSRVIVETDAKELVRALTSNAYNISSSGVLFREIKAFVSLNFSVFSVVYVPRICNKVAHVLATFGLNMDTEPQAVWPGGAPTFVENLIADDLVQLIE